MYLRQREAHLSRGKLLAHERRWDDAARVSEIAATLRPDDRGMADHEMAQLLVGAGRFYARGGGI